MIGIDTNILLHARLRRSSHHQAAARFLESVRDNSSVIISEFVLVELYVLLRNEAVLNPPLLAEAAVAECDIFRRHPHWKLVDAAPIMDHVWPTAAHSGFARRRIFDVRLAQTLQFYGVDQFATANVRDFQDLGFARVWNPPTNAN